MKISIQVREANDWRDARHTLGSARKRAVVRFMACSKNEYGEAGLDTSMVTRLLAVVAQTLGGGADLCVVTNIATLVAGTTGKRGHVEFYVGKAVLQSDSVEPTACT